jgi:hypothetical protein
MPIHEVSQLYVFIEFHYCRLPFRAVLQIATRLAPLVFVDDIRERDTTNRLKPAHGVADWQQGIRMDARRQSESGLPSFSNCKYSVVNVAPRPSARAANSMFCTAG